MNNFYTEEIEPLGQNLRQYNPEEPPPPMPSDPAPINRADDPHWQCTAGEEFWGGFSGMPFHCQKAILQDLSRGLDEIFGFTNPDNERIPQNITQLQFGIDSPVDAPAIPFIDLPAGKSGANLALAKSLQATAKPKDKSKPKIHLGEAGYVEIKAEDRPVENPEIPDFIGAEFGGDDYIKPPTDKPSTKISPRLLDDESCRFLMNELFGSYGNSVMAGLYNPPTVINPTSRKPYGEGYVNGEVANFQTGELTELATHIYGGIDGTRKFVSFYIPANPNGSAPKALPSYWGEDRTRTTMTTYITGYRKESGGGWSSSNVFELSNGLVIVANHIGGYHGQFARGERNKQGSFQVGYIGGPGGDSGTGFTIHTHISFFRNSKRVDPRTEFCSGNYRLR